MQRYVFLQNNFLNKIHLFSLIPDLQSKQLATRLLSRIAQQASCYAELPNSVLLLLLLQGKPNRAVEPPSVNLQYQSFGLVSATQETIKLHYKLYTMSY